MGSVVFHVPAVWLDPEGEDILAFYLRLMDGLSASDIPFQLRALNRTNLLEHVEQDTAFHIVNHGRFTHQRVLNAGIAYVYPFWNLDPTGIRAFSSIGKRPFRPDQIDVDLARPFFRRLKARLVGKRQSRYAQPQPVTPVPKGAVAVFLQDEAHRDVRETCHLDQRSMLETVLQATNGPVVVKPHPQDGGTRTATWLKSCAAQYPNLSVINANIHDILSTCSRVVTINSAVGIEAYLHRKPLILCGQSDFHHIAETVQTPAALAAALNAPIKARPYDKFIYWYFAQQCLSVSDTDLMAAFSARLAAQGYVLEGQRP